MSDYQILHLVIEMICQVQDSCLTNPLHWCIISLKIQENKMAIAGGFCGARRAIRKSPFSKGSRLQRLSFVCAFSFWAQKISRGIFPLKILEGSCNFGKNVLE